MIKLNGLYPPLPTSFKEDENLHLPKIQENIQKLCSHDLAGILVLGSNGELVMLGNEEKKKVYETARKAIPAGKLMIAGSGAQSTRETIELTKIASGSGADAVLVLNPSYYKGQMSSEALTVFYHDVADNSPAPVIIYNMPSNSGLDMDAPTILGAAEHDNVIGLKDSGGNLVKMGAVIKNAKPGFQVLAGSAGFLLPALSLGAVGGILALANIAPELCLDIYRSFLRGDMESAKQYQLDAVELNTAVTRKWGVPALKAAMDYLGLYGGPLRKPLLPLKGSIKSQLIELINKSLPV
ncbi:MAG: dihydrodipicolinate synthase family protein [Bacteroidales bacterium]|jgi:4-hydroxy-2-oxoglutarate aldolase|nr:dihydrodipicolinate synthase family protein [Bacteroidales bacterium]